MASRRSAGREPSSPRASFEELEIRTSDGVGLRAVVDDPPDGVALAGTVVLSHAMFARKAEFGRQGRPGLAHALARAGYRTVAFDFRGHGDSAMPRGAPEWGYDDLVRLDMPAVVGAACARAEGKPVIVLGHSLGGHVALAALGTGRMRADGVVAVAANVWMRELEPSRVRWAAKRAIARGLLETASRVGSLPARRLRFGSDDASGRYVRDLLRPMATGRWQSADGEDDYLASLAKVTVPVSAIVSDGDLVMCNPASGEAFARRCGGPVDVVRVRRAEGGGRAPGHMALVTSTAARSALLAAVEWVRARAAVGGGTGTGTGTPTRGRRRGSRRR